MKKDSYSQHPDYLPYYALQNKMRSQVIKENQFSKEIKYIAGTDVAYDESNNRMVGAVVVLDFETFQVIEESHHEMDIEFPYIPGLFSFREIPPLIEAYKKLQTRPQVIICDGHGIAHPKRVGMATHLGIELDVPTIGCGKTRLIGDWNKEALGIKRGNTESLILDDQTIGVALRTQDNIKPVFVSIGHKVNLESAIEITLKSCLQFRLPETTRAADQLVNRLMKQ